MSPTEKRIVQSLSVKPMTVRELEDAVFCNQIRIRILLRRLHAAGTVRMGCEAPRVSAVGLPPRYWEMAPVGVAA